MIQPITDAVRRAAASVAIESGPAPLLAMMLPGLKSELLATTLGVRPGGLRVAAHGLSARGGLPWSILDQVYPSDDHSLLGEFRAFVEEKAVSRGWLPRVILSQVISVACDPAQTASAPSSLRGPAERAAWDTITLPEHRTHHDTIPMHVLGSIAASLGFPDAQAVTDWAVRQLRVLCRDWTTAPERISCVLCDAGDDAIEEFSLEQVEQLLDLADDHFDPCPSHRDLITRRCWGTS